MSKAKRYHMLTGRGVWVSEGLTSNGVHLSNDKQKAVSVKVPLNYKYYDICLKGVISYGRQKFRNRGKPLIQIKDKYNQVNIFVFLDLLFHW